MTIGEPVVDKTGNIYIDQVLTLIERNKDLVLTRLSKSHHRLVNKKTRDFIDVWTNGSIRDVRGEIQEWRAIEKCIDDISQTNILFRVRIMGITFVAYKEY